MKWLGAGVTFFNLSTVAGLLLGMIAGGLNPLVAAASLLFGAAIALYLVVSESAKVHALELPESKAKVFSLGVSADWLSGFTKYRNFGKWALGICFAIFALRCFGWLLYIDGNELRIQSPNNLGDLALHITHIRYFANGVALWPSNPIYAFSEHLRYPAGADLFNALLSCVGVDLIRGLVWTGLLASVATFYAFYRWGGSFAVAGFLFNGGIAGFQVLSNWKWIAYQDVPSIAWKSIPLTMFVTQRGLLYAIPAGLLLLWNWREKYRRAVAGAGDSGTHEDRLQRSRLQPLPFWVDLSVYASMPLFHVHTFLALTTVLVFLLVFQSFDKIKRVVDLAREKGGAGIQFAMSSAAGAGWRKLFPHDCMHLGLLLTAAFVPATFFMWLITDHFKAGSVFEWHPGWVQDDGEMAAPFFRIGPTAFGSTLFGWLAQKGWNGMIAPFFQFWLPNFGILIPLVLVLLGSWAWRLWKSGSDWRGKTGHETVFLGAAATIFILGFFIKMAPWGWDNLKVMFWAYFIVLPFLWTQLIARWAISMRVVVCILLFGSGFVSLLGGLNVGRPGFGFVNRAELDGVGVAVRRLPVEARFAAYPIYNHPLLLQGRKVALGYTGHLWTQGFMDYGESEQLLRQLMQGAKNWSDLARLLRVRYIFWGREEKTNYPASTRPWEHSAARVASGNWGAIYDLEQTSPTPAPR